MCDTARGKRDLHFVLAYVSELFLRAKSNNLLYAVIIKQNCIHMFMYDARVGALHAKYKPVCDP